MLWKSKVHLRGDRDASNVHPSQHNARREVSEEPPKRLVQLVCSLLASLKGLKGTKDLTMAPHLVCSALSTTRELVQESMTGNAAGNTDLAETPEVVPEKSDLGIQM